MNEDVLFQLYTLSIELNNESAEVLRDMIIDLYVNVRGFSFAIHAWNSIDSQERNTAKDKSHKKERI